MSVTGYMYNINATKKLGELELSAGLEGNRSWHHQFKDSAYIYIGGLHPGLTEGDVVIVFSQFGEIIDINMIRDKQTGKSKGFAFICYEDQRSTILAVDNMNGYQLLKRTLRVDHVAKYKAPKQFDENDKDEDGDPKLLEYKATGAEGGGHGVYNVTKGQQKIDEVVKGRKASTSKAAIEDEDEAWAKAFEESLKKGGDGKEKKKKKDKKDVKKEKKELKEMLKEAKRLKKETKKAKKDAKMMKKVKKEGKGKSFVKVEATSSSESSSDDEEDSEDSDESAKPKKRKK
mmetsp:Transcript_32917/g.83384  ORF Transcript_32917/g.83384 Transcript_32917/m.83384 type:complete len:288 (-) Transcript_32917:156-1019(-)|eukprot:CAMPEP_0115209628 /NCGR_PEP_ID=MMETSP0270-20121206/21833_1 /TAXON_ID=71861 /ORGANISM="Scrippsiella trochoidea, Strain CCMP3099" /LENGTH=287 /DNA_ID=CAMNT_0002623265 /DNA_START=76 /DNA_END=939 /DNA_ORIENTATION=+